MDTAGGRVRGHAEAWSRACPSAVPLSVSSAPTVPLVGDGRGTDMRVKNKVVGMTSVFSVPLFSIFSKRYNSRVIGAYIGCVLTVLSEFKIWTLGPQDTPLSRRRRDIMTVIHKPENRGDHDG